jgi:hypothetical protein
MDADLNASQAADTSNETWNWGLIRMAREFAQQALVSPWQADTTKLRNLLLATSIGLGLWLLGMTQIRFVPFDKLVGASSPLAFHVLATVIHAYALWAYALAADADWQVRRLQVIEPYRRIRAELQGIASGIAAKHAEMAQAKQGRDGVLGDLERRFKESEANYADALEKVEARMKADPDDLALDDRWRELIMARGLDRDVHWEKVRAAWAGVDADVEFAVMTGTRVSDLSNLTAGTWDIAAMRQWACKVEMYGAFGIGTVVLLWSVLAGAIRLFR